jgi:subtilase family serine protease
MRKLSVSLVTIIAMVAGAAIVCQAQPQSLLTVLASQAPLNGQGQSLLTRHVREATLNGQAQLVGRLPAAQPMRIDVVLAPRDPVGLESFLQQVYDPLSPLYRQFLTVQEFTESFGPSQEDYDAVTRFATANGFTVVGGSRDALDVQLQGSVGTIESAFHVNMNVYQHPTEDRTFYAPDREPTADLPFQLWHISGLDDYFIPRPALVRNSGAKSNATTGSCPDQSFCGSDMRAAYYEGTTLTGAGQNIGLLEFAGFDITDINTYYKNAKQTRTAAVVGISTDGTSINCFYNQGCDDTEQSIDITQALGMAPGVTTAYIYVGSSDTALLGAMSSDTPLPLNLSSSWYWDPPDPTTDDPYFEKMAAQGQSYFEAAGDGGAWESTDTWWPMESQYVICVGGTDLNTTGPGGPWASESVWVYGGGGISPDDVPIPSWQQLAGVINSANEGSTVYRNGPDVSANANFTFYVCADQMACTANLYGGTSFAAPMWAGYIALANQQGAANGDLAVGFINPAVYALGLSSSYDADFHDITVGSNGFPAVTGYDLASGWGSPNGSGLISALLVPAPPSFTIAATPSSRTVAPGGSTTYKVTATPVSGFTGTATLGVSGLPTGATGTFKPTSLNLPPAGTSTLTVKTATTTPVGTYTLTITGTSGTLSEATTVTLVVKNPGL